MGSTPQMPQFVQYELIFKHEAQTVKKPSTNNPSLTGLIVGRMISNDLARKISIYLP